MKKFDFKIALVAVFTMLFNFFFWEEKFGVNLLIFSYLLIFTLSFSLYWEEFKNKNVQITAFCSILSVGMVLYHNTFISKFAHFVSFMVMLGFIYGNSFKTFTQAIGNYLVILFQTFRNVQYRELVR